MMNDEMMNNEMMDVANDEYSELCKRKFEEIESNDNVVLKKTCIRFSLIHPDTIAPLCIVKPEEAAFNVERERIVHMPNVGYATRLVSVRDKPSTGYITHSVAVREVREGEVRREVRREVREGEVRRVIDKPSIGYMTHSVAVREVKREKKGEVRENVVDKPIISYVICSNSKMDNALAKPCKVENNNILEIKKTFGSMVKDFTNSIAKQILQVPSLIWGLVLQMPSLIWDLMWAMTMWVSNLYCCAKYPFLCVWYNRMFGYTDIDDRKTYYRLSGEEKELQIQRWMTMSIPLTVYCWIKIFG